MSIFIKAGLWLEKKTGYKGEFNLTRYVTDLIAATPVASYWTKTGNDIVNNNTGKVEISAGGNSTWEFAEGVYMYSGSASVYLEENRNVLEFSGGFSYQYFDVNGISLYAPTNAIVSLNSGSQGSNKVSINIGQQAGGFKIDDSRATPRTGIEYAADYSANYTNRSLVDKGYVASIARPYKVYTALLSQSVGGAPTAIVLENTLGVNVTFEFVGTGIYILTATGAMTINKTYVMFNNVDQNAGTIAYASKTLDTFLIQTRGINGTSQDNVLNTTEIEIRVYN